MEDSSDLAGGGVSTTHVPAASLLDPDQLAVAQRLAAGTDSIFAKFEFATGLPGLGPSALNAAVSITPGGPARPLLCWCVVSGRSDLTELVLDRPGIDPAARGSDGKAAFLVAAEAPIADADRHLLLVSLVTIHARHFRPTDLCDDRGTTCLMAAARTGHDETMTNLLRACGDDLPRAVQLQDSKGRTAFGMACSALAHLHSLNKSEITAAARFRLKHTEYCVHFLSFSVRSTDVDGNGVSNLIHACRASVRSAAPARAASPRKSVRWAPALEQEELQGDARAASVAVGAAGSMPQAAVPATSSTASIAATASNGAGASGRAVAADAPARGASARSDARLRASGDEDTIGHRGTLLQKLRRIQEHHRRQQEELDGQQEQLDCQQEQLSLMQEQLSGQWQQLQRQTSSLAEAQAMLAELVEEAAAEAEADGGDSYR